MQSNVQSINRIQKKLFGANRKKVVSSQNLETPEFGNSRQDSIQQLITWGTAFQTVL